MPQFGIGTAAGSGLAGPGSPPNSELESGDGGEPKPARDEKLTDQPHTGSTAPEEIDDQIGVSNYGPATSPSPLLSALAVPPLLPR